MSGLTLKLAPKERVLINGAVIENGDRRFCFTILTPETKVLRLKDAIHPEDLKTPLGRICNDLQLILAGDVQMSSKARMIVSAIDAMTSVFGDRVSRQILFEAKSALCKDKPFTALKLIKQLLPLEKHLLELDLAAPVTELHS